ncbi:MAG: 2,3-dihydroxy-2,3-dihydrophenylpropionate dehydrogenase [Chloroflexi bacterium]|jgi:NAD(P)-dependent dehydrogenase (short-subunit alcohol dehydrogenase family)|nr:MAG: 2,3-dihydroxy-2,3-dihydrophenylpropionate dehydrogenase [Chloroflexota bacterium]
MGLLAGKVALITGAGSGIGKAVTQRFLEEGASVVALDISEERLAALRRELGDGVIPFHGDVRCFEDNRRAVERAVSAFGSLDILVGNAGVSDGGLSLTDLTEEELDEGTDEVFGINVKGYLLGAKASVPELSRSKGCMIFTLSTSAYYIGGGGPIYVASKHATLGIVRSLANELAPDIRVNGVAPSGTQTGIAAAPSLRRTGGQGGDTGALAIGNHGRNILQMAVQPEDHAGAYAFLASNESRTMTGGVINSDAGRGVMRGLVE